MSTRFNKAASFSFNGVDRERRQFRFIASLEQVDRDGEVVMIGGISTADFMRNPILCFQHDHSQTIGRVLSLTRSIVDGKPALVGLGQIDPEGTSALADQVYRQIIAGSLNAISVGFQSLAVGGPILPGQTGVTHMQTALLETSIVSIPANAGALITEKQLSGEPFLELEEDKMNPETNPMGFITCPGPYGKGNCPHRVYQEGCDAQEAGCPNKGALAIAAGHWPVEAVGTTPGAVPAPGFDWNGRQPKSAKAGRILSASNRSRLQKSCDYATAGLEHLKSVLDDSEVTDEGDEEAGDDPTGVHDDQKALDITHAVRSGLEEQREMKDVADVLPGALVETVQEIIASETARQIRLSRGRVD